MGDLVERLREYGAIDRTQLIAPHWLLTQAADEIARLREEVKRLREPTPVMIEAGITAAENAVEMTRDSYEAYRTDTPSDSVLPIYRAMIAAAGDGGR